jgi:hypothetical protein
LQIGCPLAQAFPPAPYHLIYGIVRDKYGTPLTSAQAQVVLQTPTGGQLSTLVLPGFSPGINYQIKVPMDAGDTPDLYQPNALFASAPFKLVVVVGTLTNLPIEMSLTNAILGQPGKTTRIDLTLGVDSNGDGLPDAWELAFLATIGATNTLASLTANTVIGGRTLLQQYLLGTYPFDPGNPLKIILLGVNTNATALQFPTITGRSYTVLGSSDAITWTTASFNMASDILGTPARTFYYAPGIDTVQINVVPPPTGTPKQFYRIMVQ